MISKNTTKSSDFSKIIVSLASPESILENSLEKLQLQKLSIIELSNQRWVDCFVKEFLVL